MSLLSHFSNIIFETYLSSEPPISTSGRDRHVRPRLFCTKFNAQQLLFGTLSDIMCIFGRVGPESESTFPFQYNIIVETYQS